MEKITIDKESKIKIYEHIQKNIGYYIDEYGDQIQSLTSEGLLDKELATRILENLIYSCKVAKLQLKPNEEFKDQLREANQIFDTIPKSKDYDETTYVRDSNVETYKDMGIEEIYYNLKSCLNIEEVYTKVHSIQNLRERATATINSIISIDKHKTDISKKDKENLLQLCSELKELISQTKTNEKAIQDRIKLYNKQASKIWSSYLSNNEEQPRWLVHNLSKGYFEGDFNRKYMSVSLVTSKTMGLFNENRGNNFGFIIKPKNIISASEHDSFTNNSPVINEYMETFADGETPPIKLPWEIEEMCVEQTIENSGEMLNYDDKTVYSEIVVDEFEIEAMYYRSNGEGELAPNYEIAKKMAEERGVELKELDITNAREKLGLEAMTECMQRNFLRNIIRKNFMNVEQFKDVREFRYGDTIEKENQFVGKYYKEFYRRYMQLRNNGEYTKEDILQEFYATVPNQEIKDINELYNMRTENIVQNELYNQKESDIKGPIMVEDKIPQIETTRLWTNRFKSWYGAIDRIPKSAKAKFVKMKSDIIKAISSRFKTKNIQEQDNIQNQNTKER